MTDKRYITIVHFKAFNRDLKECFVDKYPPIRYIIKRRIGLICNTYIITSIERYEGELISTDLIK